MKKLLSTLLFVAIALGCTSESDPVITDPVTKPIKLRVGLEKRTAQDNEFAFDLFRKTIQNSTEKNVFVSPLSVSVAFGMACNGAAGSTKTDIEKALKISGLSTADINEYYKTMQAALPSMDSQTKLSIANSVWYRNGFPIKQAFLDINAENFKAYVKGLDFSQTWAKDTINNWCYKNTKGLIPTIIDDISGDAMLYLMNAVYFKGIWCKQFDKKLTSEANFTSEANAINKVNMMVMTDTFRYASDSYAQYLDMPYGNKSFSMTVILPNENKTTSDILDRLTTANWNATLNGLRLRQVMVYMPRFKVENKFTLNKTLIDMGMGSAFSDQLADFSGISDIKLVISEVIHKTYITVDEEGTEAAAVTSIGFTTTSTGPSYPTFMANKPFVFVIRENSTGAILFIGKMGALSKY